MKKGYIIGIGWLGFLVGKHLIENGFELSGTTTSEAKLNSLRKNFTSVQRFNLEMDIPSSIVEKGLHQDDFIILTIPPSKIEKYGERMIALIKELKKQSPNIRFIYTSSTSVYGQVEAALDESSPTHPITSNAKKIRMVENFLMTHYPKDSLILRLGGLVGPKRHPVRFLSGRKGISSPKAAVNLIHSEDICRFIQLYLSGGVPEGIYNLVSPDHPEKEAYYRWAAEKAKLEIPEFNSDESRSGKIIHSNQLKSIKFEFLYKSPYDFPLSL